MDKHSGELFAACILLFCMLFIVISATVYCCCCTGNAEKRRKSVWRQRLLRNVADDDGQQREIGLQAAYERYVNDVPSWYWFESAQNMRRRRRTDREAARNERAKVHRTTRIYPTLDAYKKRSMPPRHLGGVQRFYGRIVNENVNVTNELQNTVLSTIPKAYDKRPINTASKLRIIDFEEKLDSNQSTVIDLESNSVPQQPVGGRISSNGLFENLITNQNDAAAANRIKCSEKQSLKTVFRSKIPIRCRKELVSQSKKTTVKVHQSYLSAAAIGKHALHQFHVAVEILPTKQQPKRQVFIGDSTLNENGDSSHVTEVSIVSSRRVPMQIKNRSSTTTKDLDQSNLGYKRNDQPKVKVAVNKAYVVRKAAACCNKSKPAIQQQPPVLTNKQSSAISNHACL